MSPPPSEGARVRGWGLSPLIWLGGQGPPSCALGDTEINQGGQILFGPPPLGVFRGGGVKFELY